MKSTKQNDQAIERMLTPTVPRRKPAGKPRAPRLWPKISDVRYREAAKALHHVEGETEIDDGATVSRSSDGGAYVKAWVWVGNEDVEAITRVTRDTQPGARFQAVTAPAGGEVVASG